MNAGKVLLFDEYPLIIMPNLAVAIGLNEAIILQQFRYWTNNSAMKRRQKVTTGSNAQEREEVWFYNTYEDWQTQFPFWHVSTIRRTLNTLRQAGLIKSRRKAPNTPNKTLEWCLCEDALETLRQNFEEGQESADERLSKLNSHSAENDDSLLKNRAPSVQIEHTSVQIEQSNITETNLTETNNTSFVGTSPDTIDFDFREKPEIEHETPQMGENPEKPVEATRGQDRPVLVTVRSRTPGKLIAKPDPAKKAGDSSGFAEIFERDVWKPYTRPGASKAAAMKICAALSMQEWAALLGALKAWHPHWQEKVKNGEGQYVKHLDRWIKDQRADGFTARPLPDAPRAYSAAQERVQEHAPKPKEVIPPKAPTGRIISQEEQDAFVARLQQWKKDQDAG